MSAADPRDGWGRLPRAERNAAYDNNAATSDSAALVAARNAASAAFRAEHAGRLDLPYGSRERQKWDIYPAADPRAPVLIFIHGGYWQRNAREFFAIMAEGALAARSWDRHAGIYAGARGDAHRDRRRNPDSRWTGWRANPPLTTLGGPQSSRAGPPAPIWRRWRWITLT